MDSNFIDLIEDLNLRYFKPYEFWVKGPSNDNPESAAFKKNTDPPAELWTNILPTAKVIDEFRKRIGASVVITNAYRSPLYNKAVGGAKQSQHLKFRAVDFVVRGNSTPADWASVLKAMRTEGLFKGGIGTYSSFVHVDTRGENVDW